MSRTLTYNVPDVSCAHCQAAITSEVSGLGGVESVEVDLDSKTVTVVGEPLDDEAIVGAIGEAGYEVVL
jgi:copper chaperone